MHHEELKSFITPSRDTANSCPSEIEFTSTVDGRVIVDIEGRHITFLLSDLKRLVALASVIADDE